MIKPTIKLECIMDWNNIYLSYLLHGQITLKEFVAVYIFKPFGREGEALYSINIFYSSPLYIKSIFFLRTYSFSVVLWPECFGMLHLYFLINGQCTATSRTPQLCTTYPPQAAQTFVGVLCVAFFPFFLSLKCPLHLHLHGKIWLVTESDSR